MFIFQVTLDNPKINLKDGSNRIDAGLDIILDIQISKENLPLGGTIDVSGGVKYLSEKGAFFLTDPRIERLSVQGIPEKYTEKVNWVLTKTLDEFYSKPPVYSLKFSDLKQLAAKEVLNIHLRT